MLYKQQVSLDNYLQVPLGLLAQVVPGLTSDLQLRGSSPCINNYPAQKKKKDNYLQVTSKSNLLVNSLFEIVWWRFTITNLI